MATKQQQSGDAMSGNESLALIHEMIRRAKGDYRKQSYYFLLWGWVVLAGSMGYFLLDLYFPGVAPEMAWLVVIVGIIGSVVRGSREERGGGAMTYPNQIYFTVWMVFLANYFILIWFLRTDPYYLTPLILLLAAGSTYLSGAVLRFRPLKLGALCIWVAAAGAFLLSVRYQMLASSAAVLLGYLVPGYMLKNSKEAS